MRNSFPLKITKSPIPNSQKVKQEKPTVLSSIGTPANCESVEVEKRGGLEELDDPYKTATIKFATDKNLST